MELIFDITSEFWRTKRQVVDTCADALNTLKSYLWLFEYCRLVVHENYTANFRMLFRCLRNIREVDSQSNIGHNYKLRTVWIRWSLSERDRRPIVQGRGGQLSPVGRTCSYGDIPRVYRAFVSEYNLECNVDWSVPAHPSFAMFQ